MTRVGRGRIWGWGGQMEAEMKSRRSHVPPVRKRNLWFPSQFLNLARWWLICLHERETFGRELSEAQTSVPQPGDATGCQTPAAPTPAFPFPETTGLNCVLMCCDTGFKHLDSWVSIRQGPWIPLTQKNRAAWEEHKWTFYIWLVFWTHLWPQTELSPFAVFYCQTVVVLIFVCINFKMCFFSIVFYCLFMRFSLCSTFMFL